MTSLAPNCTDAELARFIHDRLLNAFGEQPYFEHMVRLSELAIRLEPVKIDWSEAPVWARYHTFDSKGNGWWHSREPHVCFECSEHGQNNLIWDGGLYSDSHQSKYVKPAYMAWTESLTKKPTANPKPVMKTLANIRDYELDEQIELRDEFIRECAGQLYASIASNEADALRVRRHKFHSRSN
jgi:hypothetical protein